ncbi:MAG TPA: glycosyltransferase [Oculatellaceae cyanobacterium]|jgi:hypothetical protein
MTHLLNSSIVKQITQPEFHKLQELIFPKKDICTVEQLFFKVKSKCFFDYENNCISFQQGGVISFDTYFNSFSVDKWNKYTQVKNISFNLNLKGKFKVNLKHIDFFTKNVNLIDQTLITSQDFSEITVFKNLDLQSYQGIIYLEIEALENEAILQAGYCYTNHNQLEEKNPSFVIVICTYKREQYVQKNIQLFQKYLFNEASLKDNFHVIVVDNAKTINDFNHPQIHLIQNKNAGGSGGFARGLIEIIEHKHEFSHVIFMDDDILIDPEILIRLHNFLNLAIDSQLCIGGSMLRLDEKYIQHENGARWEKDSIVHLKHNLDLRKLNNILFNEIEEKIDYHAWWFFCFPAKIANDSILPYPFFVKVDDIEFSIRLNLKIITLNGIAVWHEPFEAKYSPSVNYYVIRNNLVFNTLNYDKFEFSKLAAVKSFLIPTLKNLFCYKYKSAEIILDAAYDFLKGSEYIANLDPAEKHKELLQLGEKPAKNTDLPFIYDKYIESLEETENFLHRCIRLITLNGHLIPSILFHSDKRLSDRGYRISPLHGSRAINVFRAKKALYYNVRTAEGFAVKISRQKFWVIFTKSIYIAMLMLLKFPKLKVIYKKTLPDLTNISFWKKYLEIDT